MGPVHSSSMSERHYTPAGASHTLVSLRSVMHLLIFVTLLLCCRGTARFKIRVCDRVGFYCNCNGISVQKIKEPNYTEKDNSSENLLTSWKMTLIQVLTSSLPPIPADLGNATIYKQQHEGSACFRKS